WKLPVILEKALRGASSCTTFLSMFATGCVIASTDLKTMFNRDNFYYCFIRLFLVPGLTLGMGRIFHFDPLLLGVSMLMAGMPGGATMTLLADKYAGDSDFASKATALTTILSMGTIPLLCVALVKLGLG
ncbi:MAG: AEC family transporter, partial [Fusobacteriaceae bacterium]|nr:AEC family transporter [Fusobacteriaceae bacterium]